MALRKGFTTGACAQAAAKAAVKMLAGNETVDCIEVRLPDGNRYRFALTNPLIETIDGKKWASCGVVKDAGDERDVTNGVTVVCRARFCRRPGFHLKTGPGIGRVTKPGLAVPPGRPAVNPVPLKMIKREVAPHLPSGGGILLELSVPGGEEIAAKTWNPRLGIEGGISIIGTSGRVIPRSAKSFKASLDLLIKMAARSAFDRVYLIPGYVGASYLKKNFTTAAEQVIKSADYIGFCLKRCARYGIKKVILAGHIGKLAKLAAGLFNTHSRYGDARLETLTACAALAGAPPELAGRLMGLSLAENAVPLLREAGLDRTFEIMAGRINERLVKLTGGGIAYQIHVLALDSSVLALWPPLAQGTAGV